MPDTLDPTVLRRLRDRQSLLWVCLPYDLRPGAQPHDLGLAPELANAVYRPGISDIDRDFAEFFWEAIWLEGADSPLLRAFRSVADAGADSVRPLVVLTGSDDVEAAFAEHQFQPVCVLPGRLDLGPEAAAVLRYGGLKSRQRQKIAEGLASRLVRYPQRVLVVLGAACEDDLNRYLYPALEDNPIVDLDLIVVYPPDQPPPPPPDNQAIRFQAWPGTPSELVAVLRDNGAPSAAKAAGWTVRMKYPGTGKTTGIQLTPDIIQRVLEQFELVSEDKLRSPERFTIDDLTSFLDGTSGAWAGYAAGLPVPRTYRTTAGRSLPKELIHVLGEADAVGPVAGLEQPLRRRATTMTLPCRGGSGATTMIRDAAFVAAREGYPSLVLRPGITDIDLEMLAAFATGLTEAAQAAGFDAVPPLVVVLDVEVADVRSARQLGGFLATKGRPVVVLRAIPVADDPEQAKSHEALGHLPILGASAEDEEVAACERVFHDLVRRWSLPISPIPSSEDWFAYEAKTRWRNGSDDDNYQTMFWVAIRFFLIGGLSRADEENVQDALGRWIKERIERVLDPQIRRVITWVAALSSQRIVCPLAISLRPVTGGGFSSALVPALREMSDLVEWQDFSRHIEDYSLRFRHPVLAQEFLRQQIGTVGPEVALRELEPLLRQLVPGRPADRWLTEQLATQVLTPAFHERHRVDWEWRLSSFDTLPQALTAGSRVVLHHWARCLYQSADSRNSPDMPPAERRRRLDQAVRQLQDAIDLPRQLPRDEHSSHLWNTLGVALSRRARLIEETDPAASKSDWGGAWGAFQKSIDLLPGNIEALLAFSRRLLEHSGALLGKPADSPPESSINDVASALGLLDEADELLEQSQDLDLELRADLEKHRTLALGWLGDERVEAHLIALRESSDPELGYYCQAQLVLARNSTPLSVDPIEQALRVLAESARIKPLSPRSLRLELSLLRRHPALRFDFDRLLFTHESLERLVGNKLHPVEQFRQAVLYFQVDRFRDGVDRFRRLRDLERRADVVIPAIRDIWRQKGKPQSPRLTRLRVSRIINEWRAEGYSDDLNLTVPLRPRHFSPLPQVNDVIECGIRFEFRGPLAVPKRFLPEAGQ